MKTKTLDQAFYAMKALQRKQVRVCIWLDESSNYRRVVRANRSYDMEEKTYKYLWIPVYDTSDNEVPKGWNPDNYDVVYSMAEDTINKVDYTMIKKYFANRQSQNEE